MSQNENVLCLKLKERSPLKCIKYSGGEMGGNLSTRSGGRKEKHNRNQDKRIKLTGQGSTCLSMLLCSTATIEINKKHLLHC